MEPVLSLSSRMTGNLLELRNPQGIEENWFQQEGSKGNIGLFIGRVIATELGCIVLVVTAAVETAACGALMLISLCFWCVNSEPAKYFYDRFCSSSFTILWNVGNILIFNIAYTNCFTHESLVRYSFDHTESGDIVKSLLYIAMVVIGVLGVVLLPSPEPEVGVLFVVSAPYVDQKYSRRIDSLYIRKRFLNGKDGHFPGHANQLANRRLRGTVPSNIEVTQRIESGVSIIRNHILAEGKVDAATRQRIINLDRDVTRFMLTRMVYLYAFGELREEHIPAFFGSRTEASIQFLREIHDTNKEIAVGLNQYMTGMNEYDQGPDDEKAKKYFNYIKWICCEDRQEGDLIRRSLVRARGISLNLSHKVLRDDEFRAIVQEYAIS